MRWSFRSRFVVAAPRFISPALLLAGVSLVAWSVARGGASLTLWLIIPVVSGGSAIFGVGVLLIVAGIFLLPLSLGYSIDLGEEGPNRSAPLRAPGSGTTWGGFVLVGPVPIVFGSGRNLSRRTYWLAVLAGLLVTVLAFVVFFLAFPR